MANTLEATLTEIEPVSCSSITEKYQMSCTLTEILLDDLVFIKFNGDTVTYFGVPMLMGSRRQITA